MANNRLYLAHTKVKFCIFLGKSLGNQPWYKAPEAEEIERFYDAVYGEAGLSGEFFTFTEDSTKYTSGIGGEGLFGFNEVFIDED